MSRKLLLTIILAVATSTLISFYLFSTSSTAHKLQPIISAEKSYNQQQKQQQQTEQLANQPPAPSTTPLPEIPAQKILTGGSHVFQTFNNCGPASLSMALSHYGINQSQAELGQELRPYQNPQGNNDDKSVTLAELAELGETHHLLTYHRPAGDIELIQQFIAQDIPVITRTWLEPNNDIGHYRVVIGYNQSEKIIIQDDSLQGKNLSFSEADYLQLWKDFNYEFLVLVPPEKKVVAEAILGERVDSNRAWELAAELAETALATDPNDTSARFNLAVAQYHLGDYEESVVNYERVAPQLPRRTLWYQLEPILAYYQLGESDQVLSMTQAIFNDQNAAYSELYALRAEIFSDRNQLENALQAQELAVKYNQGSTWRQNLDL